MAGPLPLMPSEIGAWLDIIGIIDPDIREDVYAVIVAVDRSWLRDRYAELEKGRTERGGPAEKKAEAPKRPAPRPRGPVKEIGGGN